VSKSSIISIVPIEIRIDRAGAMFPDKWVIPAAVEVPSILIVSDGWSRTYLGVERGFIKIPVNSYDLARSIVNDYLRSCICTADECMPGIFAIEKEVTEKDLGNYEKELSTCNLYQRAWFEQLIRMADNDWAKTGHKHNVISNTQRLIAKKLGLDKEWLFVTREDTPTGSIKCPSCFANIDARSVVCSNCRLILKPEEHKKLQFAGATK